MSDMPDEIYAVPYTEKTDKESPDWWNSSWGPDGKRGTKYTRSDQTAEMQAAIVELRSMVELGMYYARKNGGGAGDANAMSQALANTEKWV